MYLNLNQAMAVLGLVLAAAVSAHGASIRYVTTTGAGTGSGASWENAGTLQQVVDGATAGDEVWVAAGTYTSDTNPVLTMTAGVNVYGGFAGNEIERVQRDWENNATIIDGEETRQGVLGAANAVLDGFTITRGTTSGNGGGMSGGTATNCTFTGNTAHHGGGMHASTANNCTFTANTASWEGGGMYEGTANNCTFTGNTANTLGGGMARGTANNCTFTSNTTNSDGGGKVGGAANNCTFTSNTANRWGGGMIGGEANNCTFTGNTANSGGGMIWGMATNCTFTGNTAHYASGMHEGTAINCTFVHNTASEVGSLLFLSTATNCIIWGNSPNSVQSMTSVTC